MHTDEKPSRQRTPRCFPSPDDWRTQKLLLESKAVQSDRSRNHNRPRSPQIAPLSFGCPGKVFRIALFQNEAGFANSLARTTQDIFTRHHQIATHVCIMHVIASFNNRRQSEFVSRAPLVFYCFFPWLVDGLAHRTITIQSKQKIQ